MKSPWWPAMVVAWLGLTFPGVRAPATFFIKHMSADDKDDFPPLSPPPPPISSFSFTSGSSAFPVEKNKKNDFQSRIYPGTTYNEDFGTYPDNSLTTGFDFNDFNIPPGEIPPTSADKSREDYGPTGYNVESGEPPDYQTFYSSDEEEHPPPPPPPSEEEHRDYNDEDDSSPVNYEVEEKIPDDLKYKPPKVKVYPLPPPCKGATPPPWPTNPPPPKPPKKKPKPRPKPKPKPKPGGNGYYYAYPGQRGATGRPISYRPAASTRYRTAKPKPRVVYQQSPYLIRYVGNRPILIRHRTVRPMTVSQPTRVYRASNNKKPPPKTKEIIKEVHIHHHHNPPLPLPPHPIPIIPILPLLDENGFPVHRSDPDGRKPYSVRMTSSGSDNLANFSPFGLTPSGSDNVGLIAVAPSPPTGSDNLATVGRFAEPPPHTTSSYKETDAVNSSAIISQSAIEITG